MGVHHDNFDLWNSKYTRWNAVNMGPKKDIVGLWQKAARNNGLKFGVSEHL
jgi:alpha-L-fucosidase